MATLYEYGFVSGSHYRMCSVSRLNIIIKQQVAFRSCALHNEWYLMVDVSFFFGIFVHTAWLIRCFHLPWKMWSIEWSQSKNIHTNEQTNNEKKRKTASGLGVQNRIAIEFERWVFIEWKKQRNIPNWLTLIKWNVIDFVFAACVCALCSKEKCRNFGTALTLWFASIFLGDDHKTICLPLLWRNFTRSVLRKMM